jgi:phosphatidylserine/phosphatidylglycerophosphate/cardiolipin synthase-like enzyme
MSDYAVYGTNKSAPFTLKVYRGDGMALLAMNWRAPRPPDDFVGFGIEYREPGGTKFWPVTNRISFPLPGGKVNPKRMSSLISPIQMFRWVHFPFNADRKGTFTYRVTAIFMDEGGTLAMGETQQVDLTLARDTYPSLNVAFTRGFVSSQAFVDRYAVHGPISTLVPDDANKGLGFTPTHPDAAKALPWMGFEARAAILEVLDAAIKDKTAEVRVAAYDFNLPELLVRLEQLGSRLRIIIDNSDDHGATGSAENPAAKRFVASAGAANVKRQHMANLQHNKFIAVRGKTTRAAVLGSTNFSWRGFYVQNNNALVVGTKAAADLCFAAFDDYFAADKGAGDFRSSQSAADWHDLGVKNVDAKVTFSPHGADNARLAEIGDDIVRTKSSLLYSLAFLYGIPGAVTDAIVKVTKDKTKFVYGISDKRVGGINVQEPEGNINPVYAAELSGNLPEPFKSEPAGASGYQTRMHHKFVVVDFDKPTARVYLGSYNFSNPADTKNGENLVLVKDRRVATSYMIEALGIFDHYLFRVRQKQAKTAKKTLTLKFPPRQPGDKPWWDSSYSVPIRIRDRIIFSS